MAKKNRALGKAVKNQVAGTESKRERKMIRGVIEGVKKQPKKKK